MAAITRLTSEERDLIAFGRFTDNEINFLTGILLVLENRSNILLTPDERLILVYERLNTLHQRLNELYAKYDRFNPNPARNYTVLSLDQKVALLREVAERHIGMFF
jgi:hypothetical protein